MAVNNIVHFKNHRILLQNGKISITLHAYFVSQLSSHSCHRHELWDALYDALQL